MHEAKRMIDKEDALDALRHSRSSVAACCGMLQCVALCCSVLRTRSMLSVTLGRLLQRVAACCSVLQCVAVC